MTIINILINLLFITSLGSRPIPGIADTFSMMGYGEFCSGSSIRIQNEETCKAAAIALSLDWGKSWNGNDDFPGCLHTKGSRNKVYFNTSPNPSKDPHTNPKFENYAEICTPTTGTYQQDKSSDNSEEIVSITYPPSPLKKAYLRELKEQKISPRSANGEECVFFCMGPYKALLHHTNKAVAGYDGDKEGHVGIYGVPTFPPTQEPTEKPTEKPKDNNRIFKDKIFKYLNI